MLFRFTLNRKKRRVLLASALVFLLQSLAPAIAALQVQPVAGYTDIICTMYGPKTVFVALEQQEPVEMPPCFECATCLLQANLNGAGEAVFSLPAVCFLSLPDSASAAPPRPALDQAFDAFASRAPPL